MTDLYRPRGDIVQAFRMGGDEPWPDWLKAAAFEFSRNTGRTIYEFNVSVAARGDWIIQEKPGTYSTMQDWHFKRKYEPVEAVK